MPAINFILKIFDHYHCFTSGVSWRILPSTLGFSLQAESSRSSTLGWLLILPLPGDRDLPRSEMGECEREGDTRLGGIRPSSVSCFTTLVLEKMDIKTIYKSRNIFLIYKPNVIYSINFFLIVLPLV